MNDYVKLAADQILQHPNLPSNSSYGWIGPKGGVINKLSQICYASLKYDQLNNLEVFYAWYKTQPEHVVTGQRFFNWITSDRSPWFSVFKKREFRGVSGFIFDKDHMDIPADIFVNALIAARGPWEWPNDIENWRYLVDNGCEESIAYYMCGFMESADVSKPDASFELTPRIPSHWPLNLPGTKDQFENFISKKPKPKQDDISRSFDYQPCNEIWGHNYDYYAQNDKGSLVKFWKDKYPECFKEAKVVPGQWRKPEGSTTVNNVILMCEKEAGRLNV